MEKTTQKQLNQLLRKHKLFLKGCKCGKRFNLSNANLRSADLNNADLSDADLSNADLSNANLRSADLRSADLSDADLSNADLSNADLRSANLRSADLSNADLSNADLRSANLRSADLSNANLRSADLRSADLSRAKNILSPIDYLNEIFKKTKEGYIVYKTFNAFFPVPENWKIESYSTIKENVDTSRVATCSYGINVGTLEFVKQQQKSIIRKSPIYKLLIKYEWLAGVVVPYNTNGSIRCERALILEQIDI